MIIDKSTWVSFRMDQIFEIKKGKRLTKADMEPGKLNFIGAISKNNGVSEKIKEEAQHPGNVITVNYNGSVAEAFYQTEPFWASDDVNILYLKNHSLNKNIALFLCSVIKIYKSKFSYGRKWTLEKMNSSEIILPVNQDGNPDWIYMSDYIHSIENGILFKPIESEIRDSVNFDINLWKEFKISEFFEIERGERLVISDRLAGTIPLITAGKENMGFSNYISNSELKVYNNAITIDMFFNCFFRDYNFKADDNIHILVPKFVEFNKYIALFIISVLKINQYKFSYGRQFRFKHIENTFLKLPVKNEEPNWEYMESFMKSVPYSDKL